MCQREPRADLSFPYLEILSYLRRYGVPPQSLDLDMGTGHMLLLDMCSALHSRRNK